MPDKESRALPATARGQITKALTGINVVIENPVEWILGLGRRARGSKEKIQCNRLVFGCQHGYNLNRTEWGGCTDVKPQNSHTSSPEKTRRSAIELDPTFRPYLAVAIVRFSASHPDTEIEISQTISLLDNGAAPSDLLVREFHHCLYREKIYAETLPLRRALVDGVLGR